ncbi:MAG: hypothetical protein IKN52_02490, partial [Victivallales bacterium]|nr:hypothetical protein [Victivallales bacterium]
MRTTKKKPMEADSKRATACAAPLASPWPPCIFKPCHASILYLKTHPVYKKCQAGIQKMSGWPAKTHVCT